MRSSTGVGARRALVLALVLVMSSCATHGVRTTPIGTPGSAVDALIPGKRTASLDDYGGLAPVYHHSAQEGEVEVEVVASPNEEEAVAGSRLPDCGHACGPCAPCKRVMVSFRCVDAAESCPIAYRCMCRGRFFRVPTV